MDLDEARKAHWENVPVRLLRKLAPEFGVKSKGLRKKELIHKMRSEYWKQQEK